MKKWIVLLLSFSVISISLFVSSCNKDDDEDPEPKLNASFTCEGYMRSAPGEVVFTNNSTLAVNYYWEFGDGDTSTLENPTHTYMKKGEYKATLTAYSADSTSDKYSRTIKMYGPIKGIQVEDVFFDQELFGDDPNSSDPDNGGKPDVTFEIVDSKGSTVFTTTSYYPDWEFSEEKYTTSVIFGDTEIEGLPVDLNSMNETYTIKLYDVNTSNWKKNLITSRSFKPSDCIPNDLSPYPGSYEVGEDGYMSFNLDWIEE